MRLTELEPDILVFCGETEESVATAFLQGREVLLVDALAGAEDAESLRVHLEGQRGLRVRLILITHYMSDHMSALHIFPRARIAAHRLYAQTFRSQRDLSPRDEAEFVPPSIELGGELAFDWGRHRLKVFPNEGKTPCTLNVDVPAADLVLCSDNLVGNTVYLSSSTPERLDAGLARLQQLGRARVVPGHMGVLPGTALANARHYLWQLRDEVLAARRSGDAPKQVRAIHIENCLAAGITPTAFERKWHGLNLERVLERSVFTAGSAQ